MKFMISVFCGILFCSFPCVQSQAKEIRTNALLMQNAPEWLKRTRVEKVTRRIQMHMEWTIRRIDVFWYTSETEFQKVHKKGPAVLAIARKSDNTVHIGPRVTDKNFDQVFGHELVHIISYQKYKGAIPRWLEEGYANFLAQQGKVNYKWLASKTLPKDVTQMGHPFAGSREDVYLHYEISHALAEMIEKKCKFQTLLQLSVERKMENYLKTYCEIADLNSELHAWIQKKSK